MVKRVITCMLISVRISVSIGLNILKITEMIYRCKQLQKDGVGDDGGTKMASMWVLD